MTLTVHPELAGRAFAATMPGLDYDATTPAVREDLDHRGAVALAVLRPHIEAALLAELQADLTGGSTAARETRQWLNERELQARSRAARAVHPAGGGK
jgi:hypothetical protein